MSAATASAVEAGDSRVQETLKEFVQADLRLKAVIAGVQSQSGSEQRCHSLRELVDLEMEARTSTKQMRQLLAKLEHLASEEDNDIARAAFMRDVENYAAQLHQSQVCLRKAVLSAKKRLETTERQELIAGGGEGGDGSGVRQRTRPSGEAGERRSKASAAALTDEMRELTSSLSSQVEQSKQTMDNLLQSSSAISDTRREYQNMSEHIERSSRLLTKLDRRELTDRVLIFLAFAFFFITCAYIVKKRLFAAG